MGLKKWTQPFHILFLITAKIYRGNCTAMLRTNTCSVCDGSKTNMFGFKCRKCNEYGILSVDREHVVCPYCGHDHDKKQVEINGDSDLFDCHGCQKQFKVEIKYTALVSTFILKKKKKT